MSFRTSESDSGGTATVLVAAANAPAKVRARADYQATGTASNSVADDDTINAAIAALPSPTVSGRVVLSEGDFYLNDELAIEQSNVSLEGVPGYSSGGTSPGNPQDGGTILNLRSGFAGSYAIRAAYTNPSVRSLASVHLSGFSIDGFAGGAPYVNAGGIYAQAFKSSIGARGEIAVSYLAGDAVRFDGNDATVTYPLGAWDNQIGRLRTLDIGGDHLSFVNGASDCQVDFLKCCGDVAGARGRYGIYSDSSPGLQVNLAHFYFIKDYCIHANARQFQAHVVRASDCFGGCIYIDGTAAQGAGYNIAGVMMRDINRSGSATVDAIHVEPTGAVRGGVIDAVSLLTTNNSYRPRYIVNIVDSNSVQTNVGLVSGNFLSPATSAALNAAYINNGGLQSVIWAPQAYMQLLDAIAIAGTTTTGTKILTSISQKLGFYNATPIAQRAGAAQALVATTAATNVAPYGYTTQAQADAIVTLVNELRDWAVAQGFIKGAA